MNALQKARQIRIDMERFRRAKELVAYAVHTGITIGWEGEFTTVSPMDTTDPRFIEEVTILSPYIKRVMEKLNLR